MECSVLELEPYSDWFATLGDDERARVLATVNVLRLKGFTLRFPLSSGLEGSSYGALRELRVQAGGSPIRIAYAFDPKRQAVLLLGGDKTGDGRFYERFVPQAETIWEAYLAYLKQEDEEKAKKDPGQPRKDARKKGDKRK
jgi:hypothetical protein